MIREATAEDIPELVEMARAFHAMSHYRDTVAFVAEDLAATLARLIEDGDGIVLMHEHGLIAGLVSPFFFNHSARQAIEIMWYATKSGRCLLAAFEAWAKARGADCVVMGSLAGEREPRVADIYRRRGYMAGETLYIKRA